MKKILYFATFMSVFFTACTNDTLLEEEKTRNEQVTITAYTPSENRPDTRVSLGGEDGENMAVFWSSNDKISIIRNGENSIFNKAASGYDFTGTLPSGEGMLYATYPATTVTDYTAVPFDISEGDIKKLPMYATSDDGETFQFHHAMAYLKLSFTGVDLPSKGDVTVSVPYGVYTSGVIELGNNGIIISCDFYSGYTGEDRFTRKRTVTLKNVSLSNGTSFFAIPPMLATEKTLSIKVVKDGNTYMGTLAGTGDKAIEAGKYYTATVALEKVIYEAVDLGLSVKWATFNVGATKPEEFGDYFSWGETEPRATYYWEGYKWGPQNALTKYNDKDNLTTLAPEDDAATANWGNDWRMPTQEEWQELLDNCELTSVTENGIKCLKVTSKKEGYTDKFIILPKAGYRNQVSRWGADYASYWLKEKVSSEGSDQARHYTSNKGIIKTIRNNAHPIRPVYVGE